MPWTENDLTIELTVPSLAELPKITRLIMDRLYNAFGFDRCSLYDQNGSLIIR